MTEPSNPRERRLVLRLLGYWRDLAADRAMPLVGDVDGANIPEIWPHCFMIELRAAAPVFSYVGENHVTALGRDPTGEEVSAAGTDTLLGQALSYYPRVLARAIPITLGGNFVDRAGRAILYRSIILPLGDDAGRIHSLLCGANCREVAADETVTSP